MILSHIIFFDRVILWNSGMPEEMPEDRIIDQLEKPSSK